MLQKIVGDAKPVLGFMCFTKKELRVRKQFGLIHLVIKLEDLVECVVYFLEVEKVPKFAIKVDVGYLVFPCSGRRVGLQESCNLWGAD